VNIVPRQIIERFADAFAYSRSGFGADEIPAYFAAYQGDVPSSASFVYSPTKSELFIACVQALSPENQRQALYDLCDNPPTAKHPMPDLSAREKLLRDLVQADGQSPLGVELSGLSLTGVRAAWLRAASRLPSSPSAAITAARTMLESTCKTVLQERGEAPDESGDLGKLFKQTRKSLGLDPAKGVSQNVLQLANGLTQVVDGLAGLSNRAGDRHGLPSGAKVTNLSFASLAVHSAGTVALFLARIHRDLLRGPT